MTKEYSKTKCADANDILKKWLERRHKAHEAEDKILSSLIANETTASCVPIVAKQLKQIFDKDIDNIIKEAIEIQIEAEKPHEIQPGEKENQEMRGKKQVLESATSIDELNLKLNEAFQAMDKVYANKPDMKVLWTKRLYASRDKVLDNIKRLK